MKSVMHGSLILRQLSQQVAQARNMSVGKRRRTSVLLRKIRSIRICKGKKTYRFWNVRKWKNFNKKQQILDKMCLTSLPCGPWADLWPFYGLYCNGSDGFLSPMFAHANISSLGLDARESARRNSLYKASGSELW